MTLPPRTHAAEDAWLVEFCERDDPDALFEAIALALDERRPRLAARLVAILGPETEDEGGVLERARKAAELVLVAPEAAEADSTELRLSFGALRRRRYRRPMSRLRRTLRDEEDEDEWG